MNSVDKKSVPHMCGDEYHNTRCTEFLTNPFYLTKKNIAGLSFSSIQIQHVIRNVFHPLLHYPPFPRRFLSNLQIAHPFVLVRIWSTFFVQEE